MRKAMLERYTVYLKHGKYPFTTDEVIGTVTAKNFMDAVEQADRIGKEHGYVLQRGGPVLKVMPFCKQSDSFSLAKSRVTTG
jgi:hypothetical protein